MAPTPPGPGNDADQTQDDAGDPRAPAFTQPGPPDGIPARDANEGTRTEDEAPEADAQPRPGPPDGRPG